MCSPTTFSALDRAVGFETLAHISQAAQAGTLSVLSTEPWGLKLVIFVPLMCYECTFSALDRAVGFETSSGNTNYSMLCMLSVLSTEPWGLKQPGVNLDGLVNMPFSALDRAVGFETPRTGVVARPAPVFQCSRPSRGV